MDHSAPSLHRTRLVRNEVGRCSEVLTASTSPAEWAAITRPREKVAQEAATPATERFPSPWPGWIMAGTETAKQALEKRLSPQGLVSHTMECSRLWMHVGPDDRVDVIGTDPILVAALSRSSFDPGSLVADLLLGFRICSHTAFERVRPVGTPRSMRIAPDGTMSQSPHDPGSARADLKSLAPQVGEMMGGATAIELTGGVDSRLVLALALYAGSPPSKCFTIGEDGDPDVIVAQQLAEHLGAEHRQVRRRGADEELCTQGADFVRQSGFVCNFTAYAWLPAIFCELLGWRTAQVSGVGGEIGEGFYYTRADGVFASTGGLRPWLRLRAAVDFGRWQSVLSRDSANDFWRHSSRQLRGLLATAGDWRRFTDAFYLHHRIPAWALPVARASSAWYEPRCPLLSDQYRAWAASLTEDDRVGRRAQREAITSLAPELASFPYASEIGKARRRPGKLGRLRRLASRLISPTGTAPAGAQEAARFLLQQEDVRSSLQQFVDRHNDVLRPDRWRALFDPDRLIAPHPIGALATAWLAEQTLEQERGDWMLKFRMAAS